MPKTATNKAHSQVLAHARRALLGLDTRLLSCISRAARAIADTRGKIVTCGVGKSAFISQKVAATLTSLGIPAVFLHPTDALHGDLGIVGRHDVIIAFSHSGNTKELLGGLAHVKVPLISITGNARSKLAQRSDHPLVYRIKNEGSPHDLAPMASTTVSLVIGDMLAAQAASQKGFTRELFAQLHPAGTLGLQLMPVHKVMHSGRAMPLIRKELLLIDALRIVTAKGLGIGAVVDDRGRLIGAVSDGDIRRFLLKGGNPVTARVNKAMSRKPETISADQSLLSALAQMEKCKVTALFVLDDDGSPRGIVHMHQIVAQQLT